MNRYIFLTTEGYTYQPNSESIEPDCDNAQLIGIVEGENQKEAFKSELYILLKENIIEFLLLCKETNYPNVSSENVELFCNPLIEMIEKVSEEEGRWFTLETFRHLLKSKRKSKELIFLTDNLEKTIVESFHSLRQ